MTDLPSHSFAPFSAAKAAGSPMRNVRKSASLAHELIPVLLLKLARL